MFRVKETGNPYLRRPRHIQSSKQYEHCGTYIYGGEPGEDRKAARSSGRLVRLGSKLRLFDRSAIPSFGIL